MAIHYSLILYKFVRITCTVGVLLGQMSLHRMVNYIFLIHKWLRPKDTEQANKKKMQIYLFI